MLNNIHGLALSHSHTHTHEYTHIHRHSHTHTHTRRHRVIYVHPVSLFLVLPLILLCFSHISVCLSLSTSTLLNHCRYLNLNHSSLSILDKENLQHSVRWVRIRTLFTDTCEPSQNPHGANSSNTNTIIIAPAVGRIIRKQSNEPKQELSVLFVGAK